MKLIQTTGISVLVLLMFSFNSVKGFAEEYGGKSAGKYEVTITNITSGQIFTPILLASHQPGVKLFTLGKPASVELEILAEGGNVAPLTNLLTSDPGVKIVINSGAPLPPGQSVTLMIGTDHLFNSLSIAAMLVPTNDAFFSIDDVRGPDENESLTLYAPAYDAGTEANDELCSHIPGPPFICQGEGFNASRDSAEGFVHIHRGIHGIGDLKADQRDWRNPVAEITIRRVP
ncbi:MAG: spondin domain-containing protein [Nitrospirae bacterium]|nr:spondin domain-containing protein [Nitrospirota bacterium]